MCYPPGRPDDTYYTGPTTPTPVSPVLPREEREAIRAAHRRFGDRESFGGGSCLGCGLTWPCLTIRLLDALDAARAENERLSAEQAWDEGAEFGYQHGRHDERMAHAYAWPTANPYRADSAAPARPTTDEHVVGEWTKDEVRALASRPTTPTPTVSEWGVQP